MSDKKDNAKQVATVPASVREITLPDGQVFEVEKIVSAPLLQQKAGARVLVQFLSPIVQGKKIVEKGEAKQKEPPYIARVRNLEDPSPISEYDFIVPAVLRSEIEQQYPNQTYIGKRFFIVKSLEPVGKGANKYYTFAVALLKP